ncbi:MAG: hypothetical protein HRU35_03285, partial [Rickettsiaceae bacterium]|nr:hypothetical protein [Rickettsiaceae bacterium]
STKIAAQLKKIDPNKLWTVPEYKLFVKSQKKFLKNLIKIKKDRNLSNAKNNQHKIYTDAIDLGICLIEPISCFPEFKKICTTIRKAKETYMPSWPPISPVSISAYNSWCQFDLCSGIDKESLASCVIDINQILGMDSIVTFLLNAAQQSRWGIYKVIKKLDNDGVLLEELINNKQYECHTANKHPITLDELWLVRILPPINDLSDRYTLYTSPYVLQFGEERWQEFLQRSIVSVKNKNSLEEKYYKFMKYGKSDYYWLEFIFQAYNGHTNMVIYLRGLPDVSISRPHVSNNGILKDHQSNFLS